MGHSSLILSKIIDLCLEMSIDFKYHFRYIDYKIFELKHILKSFSLSHGVKSHGIISPIIAMQMPYLFGKHF